jgi:hypothetical protein
MCVTHFSLRRRELNTTVKRIKITEKDAEQVKAQKKQEITILSRPRAPILTKAARLIIHDPCSVSCLACCVVLEHVIFIEVNDDKLLKISSINRFNEESNLCLLIMTIPLPLQLIRLEELWLRDML